MRFKSYNLLILALILLFTLNLFKIGGRTLLLCKNSQDDVLDAKFNLANLKKILSKTPVLEYYSCDDTIKNENGIQLNVVTGMRRFFISQYALCPIILVYKSSKRQSNLCLCYASHPSKLKEFCLDERMKILKDYGNGNYLLYYLK